MADYTDYGRLAYEEEKRKELAAKGWAETTYLSDHYLCLFCGCLIGGRETHRRKCKE